MVRVFLPPVEHSALAEDAQADVVFTAAFDLRRDQHAAGASCESQQQVPVVIEAAAGDERGEVGAQALELEAGDARQQVFGVRADVADRAGDAAPGWVGAPVGLLVGLGLELCREPSLVVFDDDLAELADRAGAHHLTRLPHHRVAAVVIGHGENCALLRDPRDQIDRLRAGVHQRLVADDMKARIDERARHLVVNVVRRDDAHDIDALVACPAQFVVEQRLPGAVVARVGQPEFASRRARLVGRRRERPGDELVVPVERHRVPVHGADKGVAAAADHAISQASIRKLAGHGITVRQTPEFALEEARRTHFTCFFLSNTASKAP